VAQLPVNKRNALVSVCLKTCDKPLALMFMAFGEFSPRSVICIDFGCVFCVSVPIRWVTSACSGLLNSYQRTNAEPIKTRAQGVRRHGLGMQQVPLATLTQEVAPNNVLPLLRLDGQSDS
jgi:hypothetical protein